MENTESNDWFSDLQWRAHTFKQKHCFFLDHEFFMNSVLFQQQFTLVHFFPPLNSLLLFSKNLAC